MSSDKRRGSTGEVQENLGLGFGIAFGAGVALIGHVLWTIAAGPAQEWLTEKIKREKWPEEPEPPRSTARLADVPAEGAYRVLISDPHIDTWQELPRRAEAFKSFLKALKEVAVVEGRTVELYINGDLLDVPLHAAHKGRQEPLVLRFNEALDQDWEGVFPHQDTNGVMDDLLMALRDVVHDDDPRLRIFYLTGNHDIGISGLRYFRPKVRRAARTPAPLEGDQVLDLPAHAVWNPAAVVETGAPGERRWVYIEHGHIHDPLLWLYMRYAVFDLLRGGTRRQERRLARRLQRGKTGQDRSAGETMNGQPDFPEATSSLPNRIVRLRFRHAARRTLRRLRRQKQPVRTTVFGHTHMPERGAMRIAGFLNFGNIECEYINAGSWAGNKSDQLYWVITPQGKVTGPFQWEPRPEPSPVPARAS